MATDRSDALHRKWLEASTKFDYFVLGVSLALVGYLGESLTLDRLGFDANTVELGAVMFLLCSALCGFKRIETAVTIIGMNADMLRFSEDVEALKPLWLTRNPNRLRQIEAEKPKRRAAVDKRVKVAERWYMARNMFLFLGLAGMIAARVMTGYGI